MGERGGKISSMKFKQTQNLLVDHYTDIWKGVSKKGMMVEWTKAKNL